MVQSGAFEQIFALFVDIFTQSLTFPANDFTNACVWTSPISNHRDHRSRSVQLQTMVVNTRKDAILGLIVDWERESLFS